MSGGDAFGFDFAQPVAASTKTATVDFGFGVAEEARPAKANTSSGIADLLGLEPEQPKPVPAQDFMTAMSSVKFDGAAGG